MIVNWVNHFEKDKTKSYTKELNVRTFKREQQSITEQDKNIN